MCVALCGAAFEDCWANVLQIDTVEQKNDGLRVCISYVVVMLERIFLSNTERKWQIRFLSMNRGLVGNWKKV